MDETQKAIDREWKTLVEGLKTDNQRLSEKFLEIETEFNRIKNILKDTCTKGVQELHRL